MAHSSRPTRLDDRTSSSTCPRSDTQVEFVLSESFAAHHESRVRESGEPQRSRRRPAGRGSRGRLRTIKNAIERRTGTAALVISLMTFVLSTTVVADAAHQVLGVASKSSPHPASAAAVLGHRLSTKPYPNGILLLGHNRKFSAAAIPKVANAKNAEKLGGLTAEQVGGSCPPNTVDLGTWCLDSAPYPLPNSEIGQNNYIFASIKCVEEGGWLPSAAQLLGAVKRVRLESTINDSPLTATIPQDPAVGLKDQREMTSTLVTTQAGSDAAGSEGVTVGSTGNPQTGEPNPVPVPATPLPETLQYVTVYSNHQKGGFAGSEPVSAPENFRCAFNKAQGAQQQGEGG
jgi:hypothetical protein